MIISNNSSSNEIFQISTKEEDTKIQPPLETLTANADINIMPAGNTIESSPKTLGVRMKLSINYKYSASYVISNRWLEILSKFNSQIRFQTQKWKLLLLEQETKQT